MNSSLSLTSFGAELFRTTEDRFSNWRWQMKHQVQSVKDLEAIGFSDTGWLSGFSATEDIFKIGITPYYFALMVMLGDSCGARAIFQQAIPQTAERFDALGQKDPLEEKGHSPVPEVVHLYPDRVAFCVAMLCPVYCRYCYRKRRDEEEGLHFNRAIIKRGVDYIRSNPAISDVLITGGDPFITSEESLEHLLKELRAIPHVEIVRFGTRTPVTLPYRITDKLVNILKKYHPVWLNTHFNCAEEITPEAEQALKLLADAGIPLGNQSVLLKDVNDSAERMLSLCRKLVKNRVRPYYLFHPHLIEGTEHLRTSVKDGLKIMKSLRGNISGFAIPTYIIDTPSGKVPIGHSHILGVDGQDLLLEDVRGEIWREQGVYF